MRILIAKDFQMAIFAACEYDIVILQQESSTLIIHKSIAKWAPPKLQRIVGGQIGKWSYPTLLGFITDITSVEAEQKLAQAMPGVYIENFSEGETSKWTGKSMLWFQLRSNVAKTLRKLRKN